MKDALGRLVPRTAGPESSSTAASETRRCTPCLGASLAWAAHHQEALPGSRPVANARTVCAAGGGRDGPRREGTQHAPGQVAQKRSGSSVRPRPCTALAQLRHDAMLAGMSLCDSVASRSSLASLCMQTQTVSWYRHARPTGACVCGAVLEKVLSRGALATGL